MPDVAVPDALETEVRRLGRADSRVGIPSDRDAATIGHVVRAVQAALVRYVPGSQPVLVSTDADSPDRPSQEIIGVADPERPPMSRRPEHHTRRGLA